MVSYSHSRINCFENCPKQFYFSYIEKPDIEKKEGIEAFIGSRVHETLEKLYNELKLTKLNSLKQLLKYYEKQWKENWNEDIVIVKKGFKEKHYFDTGKKCIEQYYAKHKPFDKDKTIACEKMITLDLDGTGKYKMRGFIDRLAEEKTGHYVIHDYKTSGSLPLQNYLDQDRQLALYAIAVYKDFSDCKNVNLCWHYLVFDKDIYSKRSEKQLQELKKHTISVIKQIEQAEKKQDFPAKESQLCNWCQYTELCPETKHEKRIENLKVREFKKDEGVKLVNKYIKLDEKLAEAKSDLTVLKEDIFVYADKFGLERIIGSEAALKIHKRFGYSFSGMNKEEKEKLMEILRKEKLLEEFLSLDTRALGTALTKNKLEKKTANKIKKFGDEKETKGIRLVKK